MRVYFDEDAEAIDGYGWTVDDGPVEEGGGVVERYRTEAEARAAAKQEVDG